MQLTSHSIKTPTQVFCSQLSAFLFGLFLLNYDILYNSVSFGTFYGWCVFQATRFSVLFANSHLGLVFARTGLALFLRMRAGEKPSKGGSVVCIYGQSVSSPFIFRNSRFDIISPGIILLQSLQRSSFRRRNWRVWVLCICSDLLIPVLRCKGGKGMEQLPLSHHFLRTCCYILGTVLGALPILPFHPASNPGREVVVCPSHSGGN